MSRKALFFDIDGTLMSEVDHTVPESALRSLERARENGHLVFINSGRTYCLIGPVRKLLEVDGYLCGCGTRIMAGGEVLYASGVPHERGIQIKKDIVKYGLDGVLEGSDACYMRKETSHIPKVEELRRFVGENGCLSPLSWDDDGYDYDKFCIQADADSNVSGFVRSLGLDIDVIDRGNGFYECVPAGHSKATAIELILKRYDIRIEDAYVFGDSTNDMSMFEYAQNAVLMGHHDVELEPYASFITKNVEDDGIEYAMKKLKLI